MGVKSSGRAAPVHSDGVAGCSPDTSVFGPGPLGPLWGRAGGRSLENPASIFFGELQILLTIFKYFNVIRNRIRRSAALGLHLGESVAEKRFWIKKELILDKKTVNPG